MMNWVSDPTYMSRWPAGHAVFPFQICRRGPSCSEHQKFEIVEEVFNVFYSHTNLLKWIGRKWQWYLYYLNQSWQWFSFAAPNSSPFDFAGWGSIPLPPLPHFGSPTCSSSHAALAERGWWVYGGCCRHQMEGTPESAEWAEVGAWSTSRRGTIVCEQDLSRG